MSGMKRITFSKEALRTLLRMPANTAKLIRAKIDQYAADPQALAMNVKSLKGEAGIYRLRVGDWRVLFSDDGQAISIIRTRHVARPTAEPGGRI